MILKKFKAGIFDTNTIIIGCEKTKEAAVFDPAGESCEKILKYLKEKDLLLKKILLTHSHFDHIEDVSLLKNKTDAKIYISKLDEGNLINPGSDQLPFIKKTEPIKPDQFLKDNQKINIGNIEITVIHTPGHSPGSVCFYIKDENILISGDTLFSGSIGNISFPQSDPSLMWESLKKLSKLPPNTRVIPGHGEETTIKRENWLKDAEKYFS